MRTAARSWRCERMNEMLKYLLTLEAESSGSGGGGGECPSYPSASGVSF